MYLLIERQGPRWGWTLYSAYHLPMASSPKEFDSREECLRSAAEARGGARDVPVVERMVSSAAREREQEVSL